MVQGRLQCFWMCLVDIVVSPDFFLAGALFFIPFFFLWVPTRPFLEGRLWSRCLILMSVSVCLPAVITTVMIILQLALCDLCKPAGSTCSFMHLYLFTTANTTAIFYSNENLRVGTARMLATLLEKKIYLGVWGPVVSWIYMRSDFSIGNTDTDATGHHFTNHHQVWHRWLLAPFGKRGHHSFRVCHSVQQRMLTKGKQWDMSFTDNRPTAYIKSGQVKGCHLRPRVMLPRYKQEYGSLKGPSLACKSVGSLMIVWIRPLLSI